MNKQTPTFRDAEQISAYLDGQLSEADARRLRARLQADPELASVADAIQQARALLRQTPRRRAPRNFTLTPEMAGVRPPAPRVVPFMRLASVVAVLLLFLTFAVNTLSALPAAAPMAYGVGGMGGGGVEEAAAEPGVMMEAATAVPPVAAAPAYQPTPTSEPAETLRAIIPQVGEPAAPKAAPESEEAYPPPELQQRAVSVASRWQIGLAVLAVLLGGGAVLLTRLNETRWRRKLPRR